MESLIARQKIARRRPLAIAATEKAGFSGQAGPKRRDPRRKLPVDFFVLEGGARGPILGPAAPKGGLRLLRGLIPTAKARGQGPRPKLGPASSSRAITPFAAGRSGGILHLLRAIPATVYGSLAARVASRVPRAPRAPASLSTKLLLLGLAAALLAAGLAGALALGRSLAFPLPAAGLLPATVPIDEYLLDYVSPELSADSSDPGELAPAPPPTLEVSSYTVKNGDSLAKVARRFGLNVDTLISMNGTAAVRAFKTGTELKVPNMNGIVHRVSAGQSIGSIAKLYGSSVTALVDANDLGTTVIRAGQVVFIPGARLPDAEIRKVYGDKVAWPARGPLSSYFGYRADPFTGVRSYHAGLDIVVAPGTPVRAAMDGVVA
ncbi:MAG TPA: M23 family metallopeptidase, partial [Rectinemataceae bacterium]|nr:M23 family metallopeptidase [Rectinemataceae bacterium]